MNIDKLLLCSFFILLIANHSLAGEINLSRSNLIQLAAQVKQSDSQKKYDFIRIALLEMIHAYEEEVSKSLEYRQKTIKKRTKVRRWQLATQSYLSSLNKHLLDIDTDRSIDFLISKQNKIILFINAQPVIVSGPNAGSDTLIENKIVSQYCLEHSCKAIFSTNNNTNQNAAKILLNDITGTWNIRSGMRAEYVTSNGLIFKFSNLKDRADKHQWIYQVLAELLLIQEQLSLLLEKGNIIHWDSLSIEILPETDNASKLIVNKQADFIKVTIPELEKNPALFKLCIPWLQQQLEKKTDFSIIIKPAEQFFRHSIQ